MYRVEYRHGKGQGKYDDGCLEFTLSHACLRSFIVSMPSLSYMYNLPVHICHDGSIAFLPSFYAVLCYDIKSTKYQ